MKNSFVRHKYKRASLADRFSSKVDKNGPIHPVCGRCHIWTGCQDGRGYGLIATKQGSKRSHRVAWSLIHGHIPDGMHVLHKCDNRLCVNVKHLFLGTNKDNVIDRDTKGRQVALKGSSNGNSKLTEDIVVECRRRYRRRDMVNGLQALAEEFGVCRNTILAIVSGKNWRHVK